MYPGAFGSHALSVCVAWLSFPCRVCIMCLYGLSFQASACTNSKQTCKTLMSAFRLLFIPAFTCIPVLLTGRPYTCFRCIPQDRQPLRLMHELQYRDNNERNWFACIVRFVIPSFAYFQLFISFGVLSLDKSRFLRHGYIKTSSNDSRNIIIKMMKP